MPKKRNAKTKMKTKTKAPKTKAPKKVDKKKGGKRRRAEVKEVATPLAPALRERVAAAGADFAEHLRSRAAAVRPAPWKQSDAPELVGLERWGTALARADHHLGVSALVAAAQHGFPKVVAAGGKDLEGMGFTGKNRDRIVDGAAVQVQIRRAARWLAEPTDATRQKVAEAYDQTRQLHGWEEDLRPPDEQAFYWYLEVGQLCCAAILNRDLTRSVGDSYYTWTAPRCVGRGLVLAVRGLRMPGTDVAELTRALGSALTG